MTCYDLPDPFQRRLYPLLIATTVALAGLDLLGLLVSLMRGAMGQSVGVAVGLYSALVALAGAGFWLARRGAFQSAVLVLASGLIAIQALGLLDGGLIYAGIMLPAMLTAIVFSGLMLGWRGGSAIAALSVSLAGLIGWLETRGLVAPPWPTDAQHAVIFSNVFVHACLVAFVLVMVVSFRNALRDELGRSLSQELALGAARDTLQEQVEQRTAALSRALEESEARGQELTEAMTALRRSEEAVRQLEAPVIPVLRGVLLVPLVGQAGGERVAAIAERVLSCVERQRAHTLVLDVTSVQLIDTAEAYQLIQLAEGARLLGARAVLVGIGPEVAQTIVALGVALSLPTYATLEQALAQISR